MKLHYILLFICFTFYSCKKPAPRVSMNDTDINFVNLTSHFNHAQIEISNLSCLKASDQGVKQFAATLVKYHQRSQNEIENIAVDNNAIMPIRYNQKHVNMRNSLSQLSGKIFDSVYICYQLKLNLTMMNLIDNEIRYGKNEAVKDYAVKISTQITSHMNRSDSLSQLFLTTYFRRNL